MELYIYNQDLLRLGIIDTFKTLIWRRKYYTYGTFEIYLPVTEEHLKLLQEKNIIVVHGRFNNDSGYIHSIEIEKNSTGEEIIKVAGYSLLGYVYRRIIWGMVAFNGQIEILAHKIIEQNAINPVNQNRIIPYLELGVIQNHPEFINYQNSYGNIGEQLEQIGISSGLGFDILFDEAKKKLFFSVIKGFDRSASQKILPPIIFSREFDNILDEYFHYSTKDYKNTALIAGEGEGEARVLTELNDEVGYDRYELFVDARDLQKEVDGSLLSDDEYIRMLIQRGNEKLSENTIITTFEGKVIPMGNYTYRKDYDLGDIISIIDRKWGVKIDARITEIEEVYEDGKLEVTPTFGNQIPTILEYIKKQR